MLAFEGNRLRISINKTEYIKYDLGGRDQGVEEWKRPMTISVDVIGEVKSF